MLGNYWPGPRDLFCSLASPIALAFLTAYPTPQSAGRGSNSQHDYRTAIHNGGYSRTGN
jgi:hypothetical protein